MSAEELGNTTRRSVRVTVAGTYEFNHFLPCVVGDVAALTVNLPDPSTVNWVASFRCLTGDISITADAGTVEVAALTPGQSLDLVPLDDGWYRK